jgi:hypothetical protein
MLSCANINEDGQRLGSRLELGRLTAVMTGLHELEDIER